MMCLRTAARQLFGVELPQGPLPLKTLRNADFQVRAMANTRGGGGGREAGAAGRGVANALASTGKGEVQGKLAGVVGLLASIRKVGMQRQLAGVVEALARMGVGVVQG